MASTDMPMGDRPGNPNSTAQELQELIRENDALWTVDDEAASSGYAAILAARPADPAALAVLVRWLVREHRESSRSLTGDRRGQHLLEHVAEQLEAAASKPVTSGSPLRELAAQIPIEPDLERLTDHQGAVDDLKAFRLSKQIAEASISCIGDAIAKLAVARYVVDTVMGLHSGGHEGMLARVIRDVHSFLEDLIVRNIWVEQDFATGAVTLSAEAAVQVRAAMLEVLALHGQYLIERRDPGLDRHTLEVARAMRGAIRLLDDGAAVAPTETGGGPTRGGLRTRRAAAMSPPP
jgi:hypothetical protein